MWNNNDMMQWASRDLPDAERLISQELIEAGYNCGYSGKWHCGERKLPSTFGFQGMDIPNYGHPYHRDEPGGKRFERYLASHGLDWPEPGSYIARWGGGTMDAPPEACEPCFVSNHALEMLAELDEQRRANGNPFFLFVSFWGPHHPCFIPEPYASMYNPDRVLLPPSLKEDLSHKPRVQRRHLDSNFYPGCNELNENAWRRLMAAYWGYCTFIDHEIGRILAHLEQLGIYDNTVVLFSSDHGDMQGGHGLYDKGPFMYEELYHIPLIVRAPGKRPGAPVCHNLVSNMDLASTVLDWAGIPIPSNHDGRSLVSLLKNTTASWPDDIVCEYHGGRFLCTQRMIRWDRFKYIFNANDFDELYDLQRDPFEMHNRIADRAFQAQVLEGRHRLLKWLEKTEDPILIPARELLSFGM